MQEKEGDPQQNQEAPKKKIDTLGVAKTKLELEGKKHVPQVQASQSEAKSKENGNGKRIKAVNRKKTKKEEERKQICPTTIVTSCWEVLKKV